MNNILVWKLLFLPSLFVIISQSWKSYNNLQQMQIWILIQLKSNNFYIKWKWRNKHLSQKKSLVLFAIFLSPNITQSRTTTLSSVYRAVWVSHPFYCSVWYMSPVICEWLLSLSQSVIRWHGTQRSLPKIFISEDHSFLFIWLAAVLCLWLLTSM